MVVKTLDTKNQISCDDTLFNNDLDFRYTLILSIGIRTMIESMCGKLNPFLHFHIHVMQLDIWHIGSIIHVIHIFCE